MAFGGGGGFSFGGSSAALSTTSTFGASFGGKPAGGGGLFGTPAAAPGQQQGSGSLFGGSAPPAGGQPAAAPAGGGLFGGAPAAPAGGMFGAQSQSAPLFGGAQSQSTSLFGGAQQQSQGTSLFGGGQQQSQGTSLFGGGQQQSQSASLFGGGQQQSQGASLFGGAQSQGTSLFGGAQAQGSSLFGGAQSQSTSLFGGTPSTGTSLFGGTQSTGTSLFGTSPNTGTGLFGGGVTPQQGTQFGGFNLGGQAPKPAVGSQLPHGLQAVFDAFDPNGRYCRFRHMLYNVVDPKDVARFQRPAGTDERLWEQAQHNNPDPTRLVPVQASSFDQLQERVQQQNERISSHLGVLSTIERAVADLQKEHNLSTGAKLGDYRRRHNELVQRLFALISKLQQALNKGLHLTEEDVALRHGLEALARQLSSPSQLYDKLADMSEAVKVAAEQRSRAERPLSEVDKRAISALRTLLTEQYKGISHLFAEHKASSQDLEVLSNVLSRRMRT